MIQCIQRTLRGVRHVAQNMSIDHSCLDALVSKQVLNLSDVYPTLEQVCCKAVAERVNRDMLYNPCFFHGICDSTLDKVFTYLVAFDLAASGVNR